MNARATLTQTATPKIDEQATRPLELSLIRRMFFYTRPFVGKRNMLMALVVIRAIQLPCLSWAVGAVINGPISRGDLAGTLFGAFGFALLAALTQFTLSFRQRLALELGEAVVHDLRRDVFRHLLAMPMSFYSRTRLGRIISRMTSDIESVRVGVQNVLFVSTVQLGQMLVAAIFMFALDPFLFAIVAALAPALWGLNQMFRSRFSRISRAVQESFSRVTSTMAESVSGIRVTQGFVRESLNADLFRDLIYDHARYNVEMARTSGVFLPLLDFTSQLFIAALLTVGGYRVLNPDIAMPLGNLIQFVFLAGVFFAPLQGLGALYNQALTAMAGAERVFKLLDTKPEWADPLDAVDMPDIHGKVELRNVTFGYNPERPVLHDLNIKAEPGQIIAFVGHTGSGKTSIINLIAKFYLSSKGEVFIDDVPIRNIRSDSLHSRMAIIQQQNFVFAGTVADNIRIGRLSASDVEIADAARRLGCLDLLEALPDGLQTEIGERGSGLSLGQRQLVCFVRALLADPKILILDEATSSVDTMTEARIQEALQKLLMGRTCFVIAHRLSTIRNASCVLVLNQGRVIESGTHLELLAAGGVYTNLYRQFVRSTDPEAELPDAPAK